MLTINLDYITNIEPPVPLFPLALIGCGYIVYICFMGLPKLRTPNGSTIVYLSKSRHKFKIHTFACINSMSGFVNTLLIYLSFVGDM